MFIAWSYREYTDSWMGGSVYLHPGKLDLIPAGLMQVEEPRSVNRPSPCSLVCLPAVLEAAARGSPGPWHLQPPVQRGGFGTKQSSQPWWGSQASPGTEPLQGAVGSSCLNVAPSASVAPCASSTSARESGPRRTRQPACPVPELWLLLPSQGSRGDTPQVLQSILSSSWYLEALVGDRQFVYVMRFMGEWPHLCLWTHTAVCGPGFPGSWAACWPLSPVELI